MSLLYQLDGLVSQLTLFNLTLSLYLLPLSLPTTLSLSYKDGCRSTSTVIPPHTSTTNISITIVWLENNLGQDVTVACPCGGGTLPGLAATRTCTGDFISGAIWSPENVAACNFSDLAREICELKDVSWKQLSHYSYNCLNS